MLRRCVRTLASPTAVYNGRVAAGSIKSDPKQVNALSHVERLYDDLEALSKKAASSTSSSNSNSNSNSSGNNTNGSSSSNQGEEAAGGGGGGFFSSFFSSKSSAISRTPPPSSSSSNGNSGNSSHSGRDRQLFSNVRGLYMYGGVGCGKTYLMDLFCDEITGYTSSSSNSSSRLNLKTRRVHFHEFMLDTHKAMHTVKIELKKEGLLKDGNELMRRLAIRLADDVEVLCFDELVVSDIADAMVLKRLFEALYGIGVCCVFTSNRAPDELYKGGLNRESFLPFIRLVKDRCVVHNMESDVDHRLRGAAGSTYMWPIAEHRPQFKQMYLELCKGMPAKPRTLRVFGRDVVAPRAVGGVCHFHFSELCQADMGVADYSIIAKTFHTVFLEAVPSFPATLGDVKRRFIMLIDELYQYKVKLVVLAAAGPGELETAQSSDSDSQAFLSNEETFYSGQLIDSGEDSFQMQRTVSRLEEMRSVEYLESKYLGDGPDAGSADDESQKEQ